jgi:Mrp family chromosome partitioning ATPase
VFNFSKRRKLMKYLKELNSAVLQEKLSNVLKTIKFQKDRVSMLFEISKNNAKNAQNFENEIKNISQIAGFKSDKSSVIVSSLTHPVEGFQLKTLSGVKNIICVASCKGGVGKSTIAINMAKDYAEQGLKVGLLDADVYGPSIPLMLEIEDAKAEAQNGKLNPIIKDGIKVFSMGFLIEGEKALMWRGSMVTKTIRSFFEEVNWGELDVLVVDLPPGTGDIYLSLLTTFKVKGAVLVSSPHKVSLEELKKTIFLFKKFNIEILGVVENMIEEDEYQSKFDFQAQRREIQKEGFVRLNLNFHNKIKL